MRIGIEPVHAHSIATGFDVAPSTNENHSNVDMSYVYVWHTQIGVMVKISTVELFGNLSR